MSDRQIKNAFDIEKHAVDTWIEAEKNKYVGCYDYSSDDEQFEEPRQVFVTKEMSVNNLAGCTFENAERLAVLKIDLPRISDAAIDWLTAFATNSNAALHTVYFETTCITPLPLELWDLPCLVTVQDSFFHQNLAHLTVALSRSTHITNLTCTLEHEPEKEDVDSFATMLAENTTLNVFSVTVDSDNTNVIRIVAALVNHKTITHIDIILAAHQLCFTYSELTQSLIPLLDATTLQSLQSTLQTLTIDLSDAMADEFDESDFGGLCDAARKSHIRVSFVGRGCGNLNKLTQL